MAGHMTWAVSIRVPQDRIQAYAGVWSSLLPGSPQSLQLHAPSLLPGFYSTKFQMKLCCFSPCGSAHVAICWVALPATHSSRLTQGSPPLGNILTPLGSYIALCFLCHCPNHTMLPLCVWLPYWPLSSLKAGTRYDPFCVHSAQSKARPRWSLPECLLRVWEVFCVQLTM